MESKINRCIGYTKNNKKCRAKIFNNNFFCCTDHEPKNREILTSNCFMCYEKIEKSSDLLFLKCRHAFHKQCYEEWIVFSTYDELICMICRSSTNLHKFLKKKEDENNEKQVLVKYKKKSYSDINKINEILSKSPPLVNITIYNYFKENSIL